MIGLSVPSSSGSTIQPRKAQATDSDIDPFSSLFIGKHYTTPAWYPSISVNLTFSSLFIGKHYTTLRTFRDEPGIFAFSSLFIGKHYTTNLIYSSIDFDSDFQFPLHREALYNPIFCEQYNSPRPLSVPSSSGSTIQHRTRCEYGTPRAPFSSLFIGKHYTTRSILPRGAMPGRLSVPSSSGSTIQLSRQPYHFLDLGQLSVPSSSGSTIQRIVRFCSGCGLSAFQFPLHREALYNISLGCSGRRWDLLSVPSSSGSCSAPHLSRHFFVL